MRAGADVDGELVRAEKCAGQRGLLISDRGVNRESSTAVSELADRVVPARDSRPVEPIEAERGQKLGMPGGVLDVVDAERRGEGLVRSRLEFAARAEDCVWKRNGRSLTAIFEPAWSG